MLRFTLKAARVNCGLSQKEVAHTIGISVRTLRRYETEGTVSLEKAKKLSELYRIPLSKIFLGSGIAYRKMLYAAHE